MYVVTQSNTLYSPWNNCVLSEVLLVVWMNVNWCQSDGVTQLLYRWGWVLITSHHHIDTAHKHSHRNSGRTDLHTQRSPQIHPRSVGLARGQQKNHISGDILGIYYCLKCYNTGACICIIWILEIDAVNVIVNKTNASNQICLYSEPSGRDISPATAVNVKSLNIVCLWQ